MKGIDVRHKWMNIWVSVVLFLNGVAVVNTAGADATAGNGTAVRFGHADWLPSPTDPVWLAGQGCNWYPGATSPTHFGEGATVIKPVKLRTKGSNMDPCSEERRLPCYADTRAVNILWKAPLPGWSDSSPIVIGKRVITLHSPHYIVCWDADMGKILWKDELNLMTLPVLGKDRKTLDPAPDLAKAARNQRLFEIALGFTRLTGGIGPGKKMPWTAVTMAGRGPLIDYAITSLSGYEKELAAQALFKIKRNEVEAATALARTLAAAANGKGDLAQAMNAIDWSGAPASAPVSAAPAQVYVAVLANTQRKPDVRKRVADWLGRLRDPAGLPTLKEAAQSSEKTLADAAQAADHRNRRPVRRTT